MKPFAKKTVVDVLIVYLFTASICTELKLLANPCKDLNHKSQQQEPNKKYTTIEPQDAQALINSHPEIIIIDVRTPEEFALGHLDKARLLNVQEPEFDNDILKLPANGTYLVYCKAGDRSTQAISMMVYEGFSNIFNLNKGFDSWVEQDLPVVTRN